MIKYSISVLEVHNRYGCCVGNWDSFLLFPQAESSHIRAVRRQSTVEQSAENIYALAGGAFAKTFFKYPAQTGFPIKKLAGRRKVNGDFTRGGDGTGVTAQSAALT
jgi:hypothetical protein